MHEKPNPTPAEQFDEAERVVLSLLIADTKRGLWSVAEVGRELGDKIAAEDALASLQAAGLIHRCGEFVFPTRAAVRFDHVGQ